MQTIAQVQYKATISDIARELNTTAATVSRALHDHPGISEERKRSVQLAATKLNYKKNKVASSLRSGRTNLIGVIIPSAEINFFGSVVHGIETIANQCGYNVLLFQSNENREYEEKGLESFLSARVDGILVSIAKNTHDHSHFMEIKKRGVPLVFFDRSKDELNMDAVVINDHKGAYMATQHLIEQGFKRIAYISGPAHLKNFYDRLEGYKSALQDHGMRVDPSMIFAGNVSIESGKEGVRFLLSRQDPPDAIFAAEDFTALGVLSELKQRKIRVPDSMGLIGFANELFGEHITPSLSTVDQQTINMGKSALELLVRRIERKETEEMQQKIVLEPLLITRESSMRKANS